MVQWLRLRASTAGGTGPIPDWGTKILHAAQPKKKVGGIDAYFFAFIYLFLAVLGLRCCMHGLSLVVASVGYSSLECVGFSLRWLLIAEHGL